MVEKPVAEWPEDEGFVRAREFVTTVKVVNDPAERAVKLNSDYHLIITEDPSEKARLLQVVEQHRLQYLDFRKHTLSA